MLADSPIQSVEDLKGKKVGAPDLAGGEMLALRIELERAGLAQGTDVTVEALGYNELGMAEAVQAGRVDALSIYWSTSAIAEHAGIPLRCLTCESEQPSVGMALIVSNELLGAGPRCRRRPRPGARQGDAVRPDEPRCRSRRAPEGQPRGLDRRGAAQGVDDRRDRGDRAAANGKYGENDLNAWQSLMEGMLSPGSQSGLDQPVDVQSLVDNSLVDEFNDFDREAVIEQANTYTP